ncbi:hypothetical protein AAVH_22756 [Aphelenchoides avenae]|nr:hypothetical protein AAVH_22756 [Aphelenchus avenae]
MEYVPGGSLRQLLNEKGVIRVYMLEFIVHMQSALGFMKAEDVIHRDLKPENVLVKWKGNEIRFKVADFGLAKIMDKQKDRLTGMDKRYTNGTVCGTPAYMAPEVLLGHPYGHKADQFSVGLMIYECYTGRLPFEFDQFDWATINAFYARNFDRDLKPDFSGMPTELKEIIESALKFNPSGRGGENR